MTVEQLNLGQSRWARDHAFLEKCANQPDRVIEIPREGDLPPIPSGFNFLEYPQANVYKLWIDVRSGDQDVRLPTIEFPVEADWERSFELQRNIVMVWSESRSEWVALGYREWHESGMWLDDEYLGPFSLNEYCQRKLLDAHGVPKNPDVLRGHLGKEATLADVSRVSPDLLKVFGREEQSHIFSLHFDVEGDEGTYALDWNWQTSGSWGISRRDYGLGHAWMNLGSILDLDLDSPYYKVIYSQAFQALLERFGITFPDNGLTYSRLFGMKPADLSKLGTKDPESYTLGDNRRASEVK